MEVDYHIIKRYLDGNKQEGDKKKLLSWFSSFQDEGNLRKEYYRYWNEELSDSLTLKGYDANKVLGRIYHEIKLEESKSVVKKKVASRVINILTRVAAVLFIPLSILFFLNKENMVSTGDNIVYSEMYSPLGTRTMFYLPDGSSGCLNGGSTLRFPTKFEGEARKVDLKGEAYFDVLTNPKKPFIVSGSNIEVIAHGTSFNVEAYPKDKVNRITLAEGKVEVLGKKNGSIQKLGTLTPDQMCLFNLKNAHSKIIKVNAANIIAWKEGKLIFKDEPLSEVIKKLNRRYNIHIEIKDERLKAHPYLATFEDESLDEVINLLTLSAPIKIKDLGRKRNPDGTFEKRIIELYYKTNM